MANRESMAWALKHWPEDVYPHSYDKARVLFYRHRASLLKARAVTRIGRDLVFDGANYRKWLQSHTKDVEGWKNSGLEKAHRLKREHDRLRREQSTAPEQGQQ